MSVKNKSKAKNDDEFMAASIGDTEWLRQSLKNYKGDQISYDKNGLGSIHLAAMHGNLSCLALLIDEFKMDVNSASATGWRPIHLCINQQIPNKNAVQCLTFLLKCGANASVKNKDGTTPIHKAASEGQFNCLKLLIEAGGQFYSLDCRSNRPIDLAKIWGHQKCAKLLAWKMWHKQKSNEFVENGKERVGIIQLMLDQIERQQELQEQQELDMAPIRLGGAAGGATVVPPQFHGQALFDQWLKSSAPPKRTIDKRVSNLPENLAVDNKSKRFAVTKQKIQCKTGGVAKKLEANNDNQLSDLEIAQQLQEYDALKNELSTVEKPRPIWNHSIKVNKCFGPKLSDLDDLYPRNPLTLQPYKWATPGYLNPISEDVNSALRANYTDSEILKALENRQIKSGDNQSQKLIVAQDKLDLEEIIKRSEIPLMTKQMLGSPDMRYKSNSVFDIPKKANLPDEFKPPKSEAAIQLTNDKTAHLFLHSLLTE